MYNDLDNTFRWIPDVDADGMYEVYAWWTYHNNRSSTVPYRISHAAGIDTVIVDQHDAAPAIDTDCGHSGPIVPLSGEQVEVFLLVDEKRVSSWPDRV